MSGKLDFVNSDLTRLACERGATFNRPITLRDTCTSKPLDLDGYTARMVVLDEDGGAIITLTTENGRIALDELPFGEEPYKKAIVSLLISATDTAALSRGLYAYTLDLQSGAYITRLLSGQFEVV